LAQTNDTSITFFERENRVEGNEVFNNSPLIFVNYRPCACGAMNFNKCVGAFWQSCYSADLSEERGLSEAWWLEFRRDNAFKPLQFLEQTRRHGRLCILAVGEED